jgi:hypothetical protein
MHNTTDKMNKSELRKIVQEAIQEVLNEADIPPAEKAAKDAELAAINKKIAALNAKKSDIASGREEIVEDENIDEMANVSVRYELAPDAAAADFTGKKARIITAMQATEEPMSKTDVASALGYDKQNPINADFMALVADGVIIPSGEQRAPRLTRPVAEPAAGEEAGGEGEIEGGVAGEMSDEEIEASFAKAMASGEEEPDAGEIEKANIAAGGMSDADYEAFMQYTDLETRLARVKSDILKAKRYRGTAGDIADQPSSEVENLRALKDRLQKKMDTLLASSEYLKKRQAKLTGKPVEEPKVDDEEEQLDEWMKGRMQYYAGIKK